MADYFPVLIFSFQGDPMLYFLENVSKKREGTSGYSLTVRHLAIPRGARIALTGESGCGKSTTLDLLGLVLAPDSASTYTVKLEGKSWDIPSLFASGEFDKLAALRLRSMGYVLQTGELLPFLSVAENMILTATMRGVIREEALEDAQRLAASLGIAQKMQSMPATLSVGERQRVAICRALLPKPAVILADEPTAALDPMHAGKVMDTFCHACEEQGATLLLVTHNVTWVRTSSLKELSFQLEQTEKGTSAILDDRSA
ncbi:MAG: ATP-binding cassette domain-containing protein [Desulfovibrio sp.]|nr:ATP-binding cassette domain-containing protein [Desulfovibrio sp.]